MITEYLMSDGSDRPSSKPEPPRQSGEAASTLDLLERFKLGDEQAVNLLVERSIPPLRRWARGRLPAWARGFAETQDLVQNVIVRALPRLKEFEARHPGALQAYLRQVVANHIRDEIRKVRPAPDQSSPTVTPTPAYPPSNRPSDARHSTGTRPRSRRYVRPIARPSSLVSSSSKATRKSPSPCRNPTPTAARVAVARGSTGVDSPTQSYDWLEIGMLSFDPGIAVRSYNNVDTRIQVHHAVGISYNVIFGRDIGTFDKFAITVTPSDIASRKFAVRLKLRLYPNGFLDEEFKQLPASGRSHPFETTVGFTFSLLIK
jgi:DNA-directed RNA polymerase specialized sigma24 family protein